MFTNWKKICGVVLVEGWFILCHSWPNFSISHTLLYLALRGFVLPLRCFMDTFAFQKCFLSTYYAQDISLFLCLSTEVVIPFIQLLNISIEYHVCPQIIFLLIYSQHSFVKNVFNEKSSNITCLSCWYHTLLHCLRFFFFFFN